MLASLKTFGWRLAPMCGSGAKDRRPQAIMPGGHGPSRWGEARLIEVEQLAQERFASPAFVHVALVRIVIPASVTRLVMFVRVLTPFKGCGGQALDELIELPTVQPYPATSRAIIDLHPLSVGHLQLDLTHRTLH